MSSTIINNVQKEVKNEIINNLPKQRNNMIFNKIYENIFELENDNCLINQRKSKSSKLLSTNKLFKNIRKKKQKILI